MYVQRHVRSESVSEPRNRVDDAHGVGREHDPLGLATVAEARDGFDPFLERDPGNSN